MNGRATRWNAGSGGRGWSSTRGTKSDCDTLKIRSRKRFEYICELSTKKWDAQLKDTNNNHPWGQLVGHPLGMFSPCMLWFLMNLCKCKRCRSDYSCQCLLAPYRHRSMLKDINFTTNTTYGLRGYSHGGVVTMPVVEDWRTTWEADVEITAPRGSHLCFFMNLLSLNVFSFRRYAPNIAIH